MIKTKTNMAKDPAFLFYPSDFLTGTITMSNEEVGAYIRLLCIQHSKGFVTEKDIDVICRKHPLFIDDKFVKDKNTGHYANNRLDYEMEKRKLYSESRRENRKSGSKSAKIKNHLQNILMQSKSYDEHMEIVNEIIDLFLKDRLYYELFDKDKNLFNEKIQREVLLKIPDFDFSESENSEILFLKSTIDFESSDAVKIVHAASAEEFINTSFDAECPLAEILLYATKRVHVKSETPYFANAREIQSANQIAAIFMKEYKDKKVCIDQFIEKLVMMKNDDYWHNKISLSSFLNNINTILNLKQ